MRISLSYSELNTIIERYADYPVVLDHAYDDVLNVTYAYELNVPIIGKVSKDIKLNMLLAVCNDTSVKVMLADADMLNAFGSLIAGFLKKHKDLDFISVGSDHIVVDLSKINKISAIFDHVSICDIEINDNEVDLSLTLK